MTDSALKLDLISALADRLSAAADELTELDSAIGDGDHGANMKRGFEAVRAEAEKISEKPWADALKQLGTTLVMKVGGASGPLYGTLFMGLGKALVENNAPDRAALATALEQAIEAVKARGKSDAGQKTMLDVLVPVQAALAGAGEDLLGDLRATAATAAEATVPMQAVRGRASFLGERSIGHMDPGARSSQLIVETICDVLEARA